MVGGGIGGVQASLDLANAGFKVYLVESSPAIGGKMAQLDKTFPTNDCAMCTISPKLVETGRHLNIEILTNTEVQAVDGQAGDFQVQVLRKPRSYLHAWPDAEIDARPPAHRLAGGRQERDDAAHSLGLASRDPEAPPAGRAAVAIGQDRVDRGDPGAGVIVSSHLRRRSTVSVGSAG